MTLNDHQCLETIEIIDKEGEDLTEWEIDFIANLIDSRLGWFSQKQANKIEAIHRQRVLGLEREDE